MIDLNDNRKNLLKKLLFCLKTSVTIGLCILILINADWLNIRIAVQNAKIWLIVFVFVSMLVSNVVSALKWKILLSIHGINYSLGKLTGYYLIGGFFSNFLPGMVGGDAYRIYKTLQDSHSKTGAVISVFNERIFGMITLLFLGFFGAIMSFTMVGDEISKLGVITGGTGLLASFLFVGLFFNKRIRFWALKNQKIPKKIKQFIQHLGDYRSHKAQFLKFILISILFYFLVFLNRLILIYSLGESCSLFSLALVVMISNVVAQLPISLNGIGLLDGSFIYLLNNYGVTYESAIMVMVLHRMLLIFISFIGAVLYYCDKDKKVSSSFRKQELQSMKESIS